MRSRLLLLAVLLVELAACRPIPSSGPPVVTRMVPQPSGTPVTECRDGSWSTAAGSGACSHHGGVKR